LGSCFSYGFVCRNRPYFAKEQLLLVLRESYMHPNGQRPMSGILATNPPVHSWAVWNVQQRQGANRGWHCISWNCFPKTTN
jgi:hypothetical protein